MFFLWSADFVSFFVHFFKEYDQSAVSNSLGPDQARHFVEPDLGPYCLQIYHQTTPEESELFHFSRF